MRIFVAGATGAVGSALIPALLSAGHAVTGMTRSPDKAGTIRRTGRCTRALDPLLELLDAGGGWASSLLVTIASVSAPQLRLSLGVAWMAMVADVILRSLLAVGRFAQGGWKKVQV